jgi:hypothetical protein
MVQERRNRGRTQDALSWAQLAESGTGKQQEGSAMKQANTTPRALGSKDSKDNKEQGNETPNDLPKSQPKILMRSPN